MNESSGAASNVQERLEALGQFRMFSTERLEALVHQTIEYLESLRVG